MGRARGANAVMAHAFAPSYGAIPTSGYTRLPFVSEGLGEEQALTPSDVLGYGRNPQASSLDAISNNGDVTVPVDLRAFGVWLKSLLGAPVTTPGVPATGSITFATNPVANDTITVGGQVFTYKASAPTVNQILIGASLAETIRNTVWALNASAVVGVAAARYSTDINAAAVIVTHKTIGTAGNSMALAASAGTVSGATLAGGSASGAYNHVFTAGSMTLPNAAIEIGMPDADTPDYAVNYGVMANTLAISMQRTGLLSAVIGLIAQGERDATTTPVGGAPADVVIERFMQAMGMVVDSGVPVANIPSATINFSNNLEEADALRGDGRIDGADGAQISITPQIVARFANRYLFNKATGGIPLDVEFPWRISATKSLVIRLHALRLPKPKRPITGPGAVQATFAALGEVAASGVAMTATLVNDVATY